MKRILFFIFCLTLISNISISQTITQIGEKSTDSSSKIYSSVEYEAIFPGGDSAMIEYFNTNLNKKAAIKNGALNGTYQIKIKFLVSRDGTLSDVYALSGVGYGMEQEVIRTLKKGPKWLPATRYGRKVNAYHEQIINYVIPE